MSPAVGGGLVRRVATPSFRQLWPQPAAETGRFACRATMVANRVLRLTPSLWNTFLKWNSTVFVLRNSWPATSRLECPRATARATCSS
jgi:hypothetical protein